MQRAKVALLFALVFIFLTVPLVSSAQSLFNDPAIPSGLNGNYTFTVRGYNTPGNGGNPPPPCQTGQNVGPFFMAGSFVADGNGSLSGVFDLNCADGQPTQNVNFHGSYSIQPNGLGIITITPTMNPAFHLSVAISSTGSGRLVLNNESNSYLPLAWGAGAITVQNPADIGFTQIAGSFASGFSGVDPGLNRYAGAGMYIINGTAGLSSTFEDINDNGSLSSVLTSGMLTSLDATTGRGTAILVTSAILTHWVFYVTSANELTWLSIDPISSPANLVLQTMLRQATLPFGNGTLNGVSVVRTSGLSHSDKQKRKVPGGGSSDVVLGLFTADGNGNGSVSLDENNGGLLSQQQVSQGTYNVDPSGRVALTGFGNNPPIFYLVNQNQAFILGQDSSVASGFLEPQSGAPFSNASVKGTYWGGTLMPVTSEVTDSVTSAFARHPYGRAGNLTGRQDTSGSDGTGSQSISATYQVDATGRMTLTQNGSLGAILYVISPARVALLPARDPNPAVWVLDSTN